MIELTPRVRGLLLGEMPSYTDMDAYVADLCVAEAWGDDNDNDNPELVIPQARIDAVRDVWRWWHMSAAELLQASGCSIPQLSQALGVPYSTMADWVAGSHKCPQYIVAMAAELLELRRARA